MFLSVLVVFCVLATVVQSLNFLAVGDWGGTETAPYYTEGQMASVQGMESVAKALNSKFVIAIGDNMYHQGVIDDSDPRFQQSFETVYSTPSLQTDWYLIAGNHDHNGNVTAQISYTEKSQRWKFPSSYHSHQFRAADGTTLDMIMIDTVDLALKGKIQDESDPRYFDPLPLQNKDVDSKQWAWIEAQLKASKADHVLVVGHYPVYSACIHGNTETLIQHLRPLLIQYGAHYLSGHDHCMEHMSEVDSPVNYMLSGMGVECCYLAARKSGVPDGVLKWYIARDNAPKSVTAGFSSFEVNKDGMTVKYYDQAGNLLFAAPTMAARAKV